MRRDSLAPKLQSPGANFAPGIFQRTNTLVFLKENKIGSFMSFDSIIASAELHGVFDRMSSKLGDETYKHNKNVLCISYDERSFYCSILSRKMGQEIR